MRFRRDVKGLLALFLAFIIFLPVVSAQTADDEAYKAERQKAIDLYRANKDLEALPLFEELAKMNPSDRDVLVGLGACLIAHSATLQDKQAASKEHLRARDILLKAKELGDNSALVLNLLQTLQGMPESGEIKFSDNPEVDQTFRTAEAAFAKRDFPEAIKYYSKVLELDPKNYHAALFIGDSYFSAGDFPKAGEWYERASQMDPNNETAYRYYADMLTKNGEMEKARTKAIQAVVADPYNAITWRGLQQWANANHVQLNRVFIKVPTNISQEGENNIAINIDPNQKGEAMSAWMVYSILRAGWRGDEFKKHFPDEKQYRHSLEEETDALTAAADAITGKKKSSKPPKDPDLALLWTLSQADMIQPYILLSAADEGISKDYPAYREKNRAKLEEYLSKFVVPPAPAKK